MKANRLARHERNDQAEVGIGTMIVFIAAVIVAAIAAAVLVNTAGNLQRKSQETGEETTQEVSANLFVRDIIGNDTDGDDKIEHVMWYVSLAPGANAVTLNETVLRYKNEANHTTLTQDVGDNSCDDNNIQNLGSGFCVEHVEQPSGDGNRFLLSPGDLVKVHIYLSDDTSGSEEDIDPRQNVEVLFLPEEGSPTDASFSTPNSMGGDTYKSLA